jgi:hypothetical protein
MNEYSRRNTGTTGGPERTTKRDRHILSFVFCLLALAGTGCGRNATVKDSITFQGSVLHAHTDQTTDALVNDGPADGALVSCDGFPETVRTDSAGSYNLTVRGVRRFTGLNADTFVLRSSNGVTDETITVAGKPGDTVRVRDFVLHQHAEE